MKTLTFISYMWGGGGLKYTYPIPIGLNSAEHDVVENGFIKESHDLSNGVNNIFYSIFLKREIWV